MEYVLFLPFAIFLIIIIFLIKSAFLPDKKTNDKVDNEAEEKEEWRKKQEQENSFTNIDSLDWDGFYERCRKAEEEREKAGLSYQHIFFVVAGSQYRSDEAIERANGLEFQEKLFLEWEKDNPHDPYAVKVLTDDGYHIGYMPAKYTRKFHSKINEATNCTVFSLKEQDYTDAPLIEVSASFEWKKRVRKSSTKNNSLKGLE